VTYETDQKRLARTLVLEELFDILTFLSGMRISQRILMNLAIIIATIGTSYLIGLAARSLWGVAV